MSNRPKLSITFMTPGKKKTLEMCLESIRWMQQDFPCELVIVDTGCDAEHRTLIEQYADKIVDFTWVNDFAAARNAGIAECTGEWFMIMDDDEVIKDYKPLQDFFDSGAYHNHQWIMTMEHDFVDWDESDFEQYYWTRATRNEPGYRYEGKIHEYLVGPTEPAVAVPAVFGHYGYIFDNEQQRMAHAKRNITLLEEGLKEQPDSVHFAIQLAQEYHVIGERAKKQELCETYYPIARDSVVKNDRSWKDSLYCGWVDAVYANHDVEKTMQLVSQGVKEEALGEEAKTFLYCIGVHTCLREQKYRECVEYAKKYLENYNRYLAEVEVSGAFFFIKTAFEPVQYQLVVQSILLSAVGMRDSSLLSQYLELIEWTDERLELHDDLCDAFEQSLDEAEKMDIAVKLLERIVVQPHLCKGLITSMEMQDCDFVPLYQRISEGTVIVPYLKRSTYERLKASGANLQDMQKWPDWKRAKLDVQWSLEDFLAKKAAEYEKLMHSLRSFIEAGTVYYKAKYTTLAVEQEVCLADDAILWKRMSEMMEQADVGNVTNAIRIAKSAMGMRIDYDEAIARWIHAYGSAVQETRSTVSDEMRMLGMQVKAQARMLIENGELDAARGVLLQLQSLLPDDDEIQIILSELT